MKRYWYLMFVVVLGGACSSSPEKATTGEDTTSYYIPDSNYAGTFSPKVGTVEISQMKFLPSEINVREGDTVIWINNDLVAHCITQEPSKSWTSGNVPAGSSWKMVVTESSDYFCAIHLVMKGKIMVKESDSTMQ